MENYQHLSEILALAICKLEVTKNLENLQNNCKQH